MKKNILTRAYKLYMEAYDMHYSTGDLRKALELYKKVINTYPNSHEEEYSRTQIYNIVKKIVPQKELQDAEFELALSHC